MTPPVSEIIEALRDFEARPAKMRDIMRKHGFVINDLADPWQKLAFTFYSELADIASISSRLLEEEEEEV